jgi:iron-sulfur cluster assembly protein
MISVTEAAAEEVKRLLEKDGKTDWGLRVGVKGGGCSGLSYSMSFEKGGGEHDKEFTEGGVKIIVDPKSYLYLNGMTLDYTNELVGGGFKFVNPNATRSCSCGQSFSA